MIVKLVKNLVKLGFYAGGLGVVVGVWDYTQQAKAAEYQYSFAAYKQSVIDRHGEQAIYAFSTLDTAKAGVDTGLRMVEQTGVLEMVGLSTQTLIGAADTKVIANVDAAGALTDAATVQLVAGEHVAAPKTSLFPRARVMP
ncbi:hypothetical protein [Marivita sp.]|uniref:hypothetical protein n=1 Tax=Marivita sp. TaxID=2003365 RepID=UPI003F6C75F4